MVESFFPMGCKRRKLFSLRVNRDGEAFPVLVPRGDPLDFHLICFRVLVYNKNKYLHFQEITHGYKYVHFDVHIMFFTYNNMYK
jgi:hypothetical protein